VYYGDILSNINLNSLLQYHETQQASATVALCCGFSVRVGVADLDRDGKILGFVEKLKG
jgi:NDP-sugar pyrophosphorylase family protein